MTWFSVAGRIALLVAIAGLLGWVYGYPLPAITAALLAIIAYWIHQMQQVQRWLDDPRQAPPEVYGIWGDILSRIHQHQNRDKKAQAQLQSTVDYLQRSFASMSDGVVIVDEQGVLKWFNQAAEGLLGLRPGDRGQTLLNLVRTPEFVRYFNAGDYQQALHYCTSGDKQTHLTIQLTEFGDGDRLLFVRDETATVRMEKVRRDFVANVSHELRTPLTVISGYLGTFLADKDRFEPRYNKAMQQMLQQADRMENLIKDLLWLSRIESEEGGEKREQVDVRALLTELHDELLTTNPERGIELDLAATYKVRGDYRELHSAIANLVRNAIKYSTDDSVILVSWRQVDGSYHLAVQDRGIGIDSSHFSRLTERFYRVDDSRSSATGGTGLGLAIVKHVAAAHGARLQVESIPGKGSTFTLVFPGRGEARPGQESPAQARPRETTTTDKASPVGRKTSEHNVIAIAQAKARGK